jgi:hypothetical protein
VLFFPSLPGIWVGRGCYICNRHVLYGIVGWLLSRSPVSSDMAVVVQVEGYLKVTAGLHEVDRKVTC